MTSRPVYAGRAPGPAGNACSGCDSGAAPYAGGRAPGASCATGSLTCSADQTGQSSSSSLRSPASWAVQPTRARPWNGCPAAPPPGCSPRLAAAGTLPVSHDLLDELPPGHGERYLRHAHRSRRRAPRAQRRPGTHPRLARHRACRTARPSRRADTPVHHLRPLRRARRRAAGETHTPAATARIRGRVRLALRFLDWLDANGIDLAGLRQADVESWLSGGTNRYGIRYFLHWAARRGLTAEHDIPRPPALRSDPVMDEPERWQRDNPLPRRRHLATGGPPRRNAHPAVRHPRLPHPPAHPRPRQPPRRPGHLHIGDAPLLLPPRVADLINHLARSPRPRSRIARGSQQRWLFPGLVPRQPITGKAFSSNLTRHGIQTRAGRGARAHRSRQRAAHFPCPRRPARRPHPHRAEIGRPRPA